MAYLKVLYVLLSIYFFEKIIKNTYNILNKEKNFIVFYYDFKVTFEGREREIVPGYPVQYKQQSRKRVWLYTPPSNDPSERDRRL